MRAIAFVIVLGGAMLAACASTPAPETPPGTAAPGDQVGKGAQLYAKNCAGCHGANGEGTDNGPAVVGKSALPLDPPAARKFRKTQFHTAADVGDFVAKNMPPPGGKLTADEAFAILAFDLKANGVDLQGKTVDASNAGSFVLHP